MPLAKPFRTKRPGLGPLLLVLALVVVLAVMFWSLESRHDTERAVAVPHDMDAAESELKAHYDATLEYLTLLAEDMEDGRLSASTFYLRADAYLRDHQELKSLAWADAGFVYDWVAPHDEKTRPLVGTPVTISQEEDAAHMAKESRHAAVSEPYIAIRGARSMALFVPVFAGDRFLGTFSAIVSLKGLLDYAVPPWVQSRYELSLLDGSGIVLARHGTGANTDASLGASKTVNLTGRAVGLRLQRYAEGIDWELALFAALTVGLATGVTLTVVELGRDNRRRRQIADEMQRARDLAESANQSKTEFLANVSHEIRTPIGAIIGYAEMLLMQGGLGDAPNEMLQAVRRNGQNLLVLINDLLDMTKVEAGLLEVEVQSTQVAGVVDEVLLVVRPLAAAKGLGLTVQVSSPVPAEIATDPARLRQSLVNVMSNAVKFTPRGRVALTLRFLERPNDASLLAFAVSDTGIGIRTDHQERLFRNFVQADSSIARRFGGTGIGLALSRKLARLLGGDLVLTSTEVGRGTTFTLTVATGPIRGVPLITELPAARESSEPASGDGNRLAGRRLLLVEDSVDSQVILHEFLISEGAEVDVAGDGAQALAKVRGGAFYDAILMDIQLPGLDGYDTTRELRASGCTQPVLALTAHAMKGERERCLAAGCDDFLSKPVDMERLILAVAAICGIAEAPPLVSELLGNERVRRVLGGFLSRLPDRVASMRAALEAENFTELATLAHSLKGTAGSYGFPSISLAAGEVEEAARSTRDKAALAVYIANLISLERRAQRGRSLLH